MRLQIDVKMSVRKSLVINTEDFSDSFGTPGNENVFEIAKLISKISGNPMSIMDEYEEEVETTSDIESTNIQEVIEKGVK